MSEVSSGSGLSNNVRFRLFFKFLSRDQVFPVMLKQSKCLNCFPKTHIIGKASS